MTSKRWPPKDYLKQARVGWLVGWVGLGKQELFSVADFVRGDFLRDSDNKITTTHTRTDETLTKFE